ncbi:cadmium, zinc and cobalt-transporting ATPase [Oxobacter pfennigii]|uniref:Cadmium, zinc and cobalt-transporting ATPase n=1 Tax=Oxobacter pfennigii TaxID=36849 RepID=A0A0P8W5R6_9CLOT|nr:heavy metal translocating P-type ATPase [Oxobacter pfennigii]KPU43303.1 cadmium, zinc and cobalt-transporting ATPase [Oxobacter pfennigii]
MEAAARKELILEGLCCANCAAKIEAKVKELDGVSLATINFVNKTLIIEAQNTANINEIIDKTKAIVNRIESDVVVKEKTILKSEKKVLILMGLCCTNCAAKIEREVAKLPGVKSAVIDFTSQRLIFESDGSEKVNIIVTQVEKIVNRIEPDVKVLQEEKGKKVKYHAHDEEEGSIKNELIKSGIGAAFFIVAIVFNFSYWTEFALFLISYLLIGGEVVLKALKNIKNGQIFDENFLMTIATIGAFAISEFPEGVAVMLFYQIGELFQNLAVNRSRKSITELMDIKPEFANIKINGEERKLDPDDVRIGDVIIVKPGEKIPLDGKVIAGKSMVDTIALTGESVPREVEEGSEVLAGFINKNGLLEIEVTKEFGESTVSKILDMVQNATSRKAPTESFITKFARYYTPVVVFSALAIAVIPPFVIPGASFSDWVYRALVFLVVSCPCALVVSIPLGFFGGIGGASRKGILIKGSNYLEALNSVDVVVFDKTGTLTKGVFKVTKVSPQDGVTPEELLTFAAYAESYSNHPIATSILNAYQKDVDKEVISDYEEVPGQGISVKVDGKEVLAGNYRLMVSKNIPYENVDTAGSVIHVAVDKNYAGNIVISDEIKEDSKEAIRALKGIGVKKTVMLTGDNKSVASKVGAELGLDEVYAELLPDQKVERLELIDKEKSSKGKMIFVGDGINDAPVLARADIGFAMGGLGSDAAIEAADVVIMTDEPSKVAGAIKIARRTKTIIWQNIVFAIVVKVVIMALGAGGLATMWEAVFGDVGVTLIAVLNVMRVLKTDNI